MPSRVKVGANKFCYSGPTCKLHSTFWVKDAKSNLAGAQQKMLNAVSFEDFNEARAGLQSAQAEYDSTTDGLSELRVAVSQAEGTEQEALQLRLKEAQSAQKKSAKTAAEDFLSSKSVAERQVDVFSTKDVEKLSLYAKDKDESVRASLALNPKISAVLLRSLSREKNEKVQGNVALNSKVTKTTLEYLKKNGVSPYVKALANAQLQKQIQVEEKAASAERTRREAQASYVSSYSYSGKGGGK